MKQYKKTPVLPLLLIGFVTCLMFSMMSLGGKVNWNCFLGAESVYDFPQKDLKKSSKGWTYDESLEGYSITNGNAVNKYRVDYKSKQWKYLYVTLEQLSVPVLSASLEYYNKDGELLGEQAIQLMKGKNEICMNEEIKVYRIGIRVRDAKGTFFSIASMQARSEAEVYTSKRFLGSMCVFVIIFGIGCALWTNIRKRRGVTVSFSHLYGMVDVLQTCYILVGDYFGIAFYRRIGKKGRDAVLRMTLCVFFAWIFFFAVMDWANDEQYYRFFVLGCIILLVLAGSLLWERELVKICWRTPGATAWVVLWIVVILSDAFVEQGNKFIGYIMLLAGGYFIFIWNQMKYPKKVFYILMESLEIDFLLVTVICMICRQQKISVYYNGIFPSAEEFAMYALLMYAIFFIGAYRRFTQRAVWWKCVTKVVGLAISLYFVERSAGIVGYIALILITVIALIVITIQCRGMQRLIQILRGQIVKILIACCIGVFTVLVVHAATKYLPEYLGTNCAIEGEFLVSNLPTSELDKYKILLPDELEDVKSQDTLEIQTYQKSYARMLNLMGHMSEVRVYRKIVSPYCGYLGMMYRYGVYALIPFLLFQIYSIVHAIGGLKCQNIDEHPEHLMMLLVDMIAICFCVCGNFTVSITQPIVWFFYLMNGYYFIKKENSR